MREKFATYA